MLLYLSLNLLISFAVTINSQEIYYEVPGCL